MLSIVEPSAAPFTTFGHWLIELRSFKLAASEPLGHLFWPSMLRGDFPETRLSLIVNARHDGGRLDEWCQKYHPAIVQYLVALGCSEDEAQDIAQEFFFRLLEKGPQRLLPTDLRGSFRAYLKRSVRNFLIDQRRSRVAQKHGAGAEHVPLANIEEQLADGPNSPARQFDQSWLLAIMGNAIEMLCEGSNDAL